MSSVPREGTTQMMHQPFAVSQHVVALVAASAARTAAHMGADPETIALAVATAVQQVAFDAVQIGAAIPTPAPTAPPAIPAPDVNLESSADASATEASTEQSTSASLDASTVSTVSSNSSDAAASGQSYAISTDVSTNSLDASADANIPVLTKRQRRRQRQRQRLTRQQATVDVVTAQPQFYDISLEDNSDLEDSRTLPDTQLEDVHILSDVNSQQITDYNIGLFSSDYIQKNINDFEEDLGINEKQLEDGITRSDIHKYPGDGRTFSDTHKYPGDDRDYYIHKQPEDGRTLSDVNSQINTDYNIGLCSNYNIQSNINDLEEDLGINEKQPDDGSTLSDIHKYPGDGRTFSDTHKYPDDRDYNIHKQPEDGRTLSDINSQKNTDYNIGLLSNYTIQKNINDSEEDTSIIKNQLEDGSTLSDIHKYPGDGCTFSDTPDFLIRHYLEYDRLENHESHDSDESADNHEHKRILSDHSIQNETHLIDRVQSLLFERSDFERCFIQPAVPPVVHGDGADPGAASRCSWCLPAVPPRLAAHDPEVSARSELTELAELSNSRS